MLGKLNQREEEVLRAFSRTVYDQFGENIENMKLYGSKARGDFHAESDIDVLVLMREGDFETRDRIVDIAADYLVAQGILISPIVLNQSQYQKEKRWETGFYRDLQKDGVALE